ncbi:MAG TPA: hypothetical protein VIL88_01965 [Devosia sp.]|jgi:DNA gyrase/topoisomerase IV subunit A|uniref:hypothetical protein n=1 Tax=Devosia sp. TaxID=1871048 RepID=UPI002F93C759
MTSLDIKALENAGRDTLVWVDGYDGQTHQAHVLKSLAPALLILAIAACLLVAML